MQNQTELERIVQRMIDAGEPEENIAAVIRNFKKVEIPKPPSPSDKPAANIRTVNPKTGQVHMITPQEYESRVKGLSTVGEIFSSPFTGAAKVAHGLYGMVTGQHGAEEEPSEYPRLKAFSEAVRGVGEAFTPVLYDVGIGAAFPAATKVVGLGGSFFPMAQAAKVAVPSMAAQKGTEFVAEAAGAPPEVATALGDVAGLGTGVGTTKLALSAGRQRIISKLPERQLIRYSNEIYDLLPTVVKNAIADTPQEAQLALQKALPEIVAHYRKNPDFQLALEKGRPEDAKQVIEHFYDALDVAIGDIMGTLKSNVAPIASNKIPVVNPIKAVKNDLLDEKTASTIADRVLRQYNIVNDKDQFIPRSLSEWENKITDLNTALRSIKQRANVQKISDLQGSDQEFRSIDRLVKTIRKQLGEFMDSQGVEIGKEYRESRRLVANLRDVRDAISDNFMFAGRQPVTPEGVAAGLTQSGFAPSEAGRAAGSGIPRIMASVFTKTKLKELFGKDVNKALLDIIRKADAGDIGPSAPRPSTKPQSPLAALPAHETPIITPPPADVSGPQPFDYTAGAPSGTFTRPGYAVSEKATPLPTRPQAPPPNIPPVTSGYGPAQARELGAQTRVPGGAFEPSAITFGGRTAEQVLPSTAEAGIRLGNIRGDYQTMKLAYPDMPDVSNNGRFKVTLPSGDVVRFSTKNAQQNAQRFVDQFIREFGR